MADVGAGAVGWVELMASFDELSEFCFEGFELTLPLVYVGEFGFEQIDDVVARGRSTVVDSDDAADFGQSEAC